MKKFLLILCIYSLFIPGSAFAEDSSPDQSGWSFSVGVGGVYSPTYLGDDEYQLSLVPNIRIAYEDKFFASVREGIGYNVINSNGLRIGPVVKYDFGRDEDGSNPFALGDDSDDLDGLGDVDGTLEAGGFIEYTYNAFTGKLGLRQGLGGHEGFIADLGVTYGGAFEVYNQNVLYSFGPELRFTSSSYNDEFFTVNTSQSARSGLDTYDADDSTVSYGFGANLIIPHTERISTVLFAKYTLLGDEIANSSLVEERGSEHQVTTGAFLNYSF